MSKQTSDARGHGRASGNGNTRKAGREQYYTPPSTAEHLVGVVTNLVPDLSSRAILEPAGGTGAFVNAFVRAGLTTIRAYDVEPKHELVKQADFLSLELPPTLTGAVAITNPPFGRNQSLSVPFFNKLADHCSHIGFVVPKSWRKWSVQNRLDSRFHLIHDEELSIDYVDEAGSRLPGTKGSLRTVFQVWERREEKRPKIVVHECGLFVKTTPALADVALTVFGRGCGTVKTDFPRTPNTTKMFLKLTDPVGLEALRGADFEQYYSNVAFVEALSWAEINSAVRQWCEARNLTV